SRRRHTSFSRDWSSDVCSSDLWQSSDGTRYRVELQQRYQKLIGELWINDGLAELETALLWGDLLELIIQDDQNYEAQSIVMHCQDRKSVRVGEECGSRRWQCAL